MDFAKTSATDANGNVFMGMDFTGTTVFGDSTFTAFAYDFSITKYDQEGNLIKAYHFIGRGDGRIADLRVDVDGNVFAKLKVKKE